MPFLYFYIFYTFLHLLLYFKTVSKTSCVCLCNDVKHSNIHSESKTTHNARHRTGDNLRKRCQTVLWIIMPILNSINLFLNFYDLFLQTLNDNHNLPTFAASLKVHIMGRSSSENTVNTQLNQHYFYIKSLHIVQKKSYIVFIL